MYDLVFVAPFCVNGVVLQKWHRKGCKSLAVGLGKPNLRTKALTVPLLFVHWIFLYKNPVLLLMICIFIITRSRFFCNIIYNNEATIVVIEVEHEEIFVRRGETVNLTGSSAWGASFAVDGVTGEDYRVENGEMVYDITGMDFGKHIVEIAHDFSEFDDGEFPPRETVKIVSVIAWGAVGDEADDMDTDSDRASVVEFVASKIAGMIENDSTADNQVAIYDDIESLKDALRDGVDIMTRLEVRLLDESEWEYAEAHDKVMLKIEDENGVVAIYEACLVIYAGDEEIGLVYELDDPITMRLAIPEEYVTTPDGYTRTFYVVRGHIAVDDTENAERIEVTRDGNDLVFLNNKFSSFAVVYTDKLIPPVAPNTGFMVSENSSVSTSNLVTIILALFGALTLAGAAMFAKRK